MSLVWTGDSTFDMTFTSGHVGACNVGADGLSFDCASFQTEDDTPKDFGLDALILLDITNYGEIRGPDSMYMTSDVVMTCDGDCALVEAIIGGKECFLQLGFDTTHSE